MTRPKGPLVSMRDAGSKDGLTASRRGQDKRGGRKMSTRTTYGKTCRICGISVKTREMFVLTPSGSQ